LFCSKWFLNENFERRRCALLIIPFP